MNTRNILFVLIVTLVASSSAIASVSPPIKISREGTPTYAEAGTPYTGNFLIQTKAPLEVELIAVTGEGWSNTFLSAPSFIAMGTDDSYDAAFGGTPSPTAGPLYLEYAVAGKNARQVLDLGPRGSAKRRQVAGIVTPLPDRPVVKSNSDNSEHLAPIPPPKYKVRAPELRTIFDESDDMGGNAEKRSWTITVTGRVHFILPAWEAD